MKFYIDEQGNRYSVNAQTDERTLIQPCADSGGENASDPVETADNNED